MAVNVPQIDSGTGPVTLTYNPPKRFILVENADDPISGTSLAVKWNGSTNGWTLPAGTRKGNWVKGGVSTIQITSGGNPSWQIEAYD